MEKKEMDANYPSLIICLVIFVFAVGCTTNTTPSEISGTARATSAVPVMNLSLPSLATIPAVFPHGSLQDPGAICNPEPRIPVPVDTSVPIQDPMPGIRYSLNRSDSGRTIELGKGDIIEINLGFAPGLAMRWIVPVSGCGIELVNDGNYYTAGDFWNSTGYYRARYRAVSPGTSALNGKLVVSPAEDLAGDPRFILTVIVK